MLVPNRHESTDDYRYGFNGMEKDDEMKGKGNNYFTHHRLLDPRIGRWLSLDPKGDHPNQIGISPYALSWNNPIRFNDPNGDCPFCWGFIIGAAIEYTSQVIANISKGDSDPFKNINYQQVFIGGLAGGLTGGLNSFQILKSSGVAAKVYVQALNTSITVAESVAKQAVDDGFDGEFSASGILTDVAIDIVPIPINKLKLGSATEKAIKQTSKELDRATRLAKGTTKASRKEALKESQEKMVELTTKNDNIKKVEEIIVKQTQSGSGDIIKDFNSTNVTYSVNYYGDGGIPYGGGAYNYDSKASAEKALNKEKRALKAGKLAEGITEVRIDEVKVNK